MPPQQSKLTYELPPTDMTQLDWKCVSVGLSTRQCHMLADNKDTTNAPQCLPPSEQYMHFAGPALMFCTVPHATEVHQLCISTQTAP